MIIHQITNNLTENVHLLQMRFATSADINMHQFDLILTDHSRVTVLSISVQSLIDLNQIHTNVIEPMIQQPFSSRENLIQEIQQRIFIKNGTSYTQLEPCLEQVVQGGVAFFFDGLSRALVISAPGTPARSIEEPSTEATIRGSHEGFVESISTNMALIRKRIKDARLRFQSVTIGTLTHTQVVVAFIDGLTAPAMIHTALQKLQQIKVDSINSSGDIEQMIEADPWTIFTTVGNTEKPDRAAALLAEGRILILVDGDPTILYGPHLFIEAFQSPEDYSSRPYYVSFIRLLRFISFFISIYTPALFIAALNFHKEMIPVALLPNFQGANEKAPFPIVFEIVVMLVMFEVVREAGVRLPKTVGSAVSIVGALILGQVSVQAGLVSAPSIIVVAVSVIASFLLTPIADVVSLLRIFNLIAVSIFGLFGLFMVTVATITHMVTLRSLGVPYMAPIAPLHFRDWKDTLVRVSVRLNKMRPESIPTLQPKRIDHLPRDEKNP
ncbi:spore germination protein [Sulfoacidibacillus thermotolerans]|uniref:Spore germination protein n=1 Tax=Sulfoacidibacillus thermotolerans TaxID=1765684 RepID=A0A2U3D8A4_SULT2|nr:spore germination protein [Sulfoacidibacillus thermotolerans]PWI57489.1 hypothetical protein BM613_08430 [Sulfoacidibacillus thermotolerans]